MHTTNQTCPRPSPYSRPSVRRLHVVRLLRRARSVAALRRHQETARNASIVAILLGTLDA